MMHTLLLTGSLGLAAPLSVGVYAPYGYQPGARVGLAVPLHDAGLYIGPRAAVFSRLGNHTSAEVGLDVGYRHQKAGRPWYTALALGAGYQLAAEVDTVEVSIGSGSTTKTREPAHYAVPTLSAQAGRALHSGLVPYGRLDVGWKVAPQGTSRAFFSVEVGVRFGGARR